MSDFTAVEDGKPDPIYKCKCNRVIGPRSSILAALENGTSTGINGLVVTKE